MAPWGKESRRPQDSHILCPSREDMVQVCERLLLRLGGGYHPPADLLGGHGVNPKWEGESIGVLGC
jgi:hypothetical protein